MGVVSPNMNSRVDLSSALERLEQYVVKVASFVLRVGAGTAPRLLDCDRITSNAYLCTPACY